MTQFRWAEKAAGEVVYGSEPIYVSPKLLAGLLKKIPQRELMRAVASIRG